MELDRDDEGRLTLLADGLSLTGDLSRLRRRLHPHALSRELLVRAARMRDLPPGARAIDACAGLGEDGALLAAAGFEVTLIERDPLVFALLEDAVTRAREDASLGEVARRMHPVEGDALDLLPALTEPPALVYLDPMFPARHKDAATKKKLQVLRKLEQPASDEEGAALVDAALACHPRRIVVKRPLRAEPLGGVKPTHALAGKLIRYDCLLS